MKLHLILVCLLLSGALVRTTAQAPADSLRAAALIAECKKLYGTGEHAAALEKARQAQALLAAQYGPEALPTADAAMYVGRELRYLDRPNEAISVHRECLAVFAARRDTLRMARCRHNIGLALRDLRRLDEAHRELRQVMELLRPDSARHALFLADVQAMRGSIFNAERNYRAAIPTLEAARAVYVAQQNSPAAGIAGYHLGTAWLRLHDFDRARESFLTALANLRGQLPPEHSYFADLYVKIALCCQETDDAAAALAYLREAGASYRLQGETSDDYIDFLQNFGLYYLRERQYDAAIEQLEACRALREKQPAPNPYILTSTLDLLGEAYGGARRFDRADACYRRAVALVADSAAGNPLQRGRLLARWAELALRQGDFAGCLRRCDSASALVGFDPARPEAMLPRDQSRAFCQRYGRAWFEGYRQQEKPSMLDDAERYLAAAVRILLLEVAEISVNNSRENYYNDDYAVLEQWLDARMALFAHSGTAADAAAAFMAAARGKAFLLSQSVGQHAALERAGVPDSLLQSLYVLREKIAGAEAKLGRSLRRPGADPDSLALALNRSLEGWRIADDALVRRIRADYPDPAGAQAPVPVARLQREGLAPDQALLMYSLTAERRYVFLLRRDTLVLRQLPKDSTLLPDIDRFNAAMTAYYAGANPDDALYDRSLESLIELGQSLYRRLVMPVAGLLPTRVVIIPEGPLWYLPFEALLTASPADPANFRTFPFWLRGKAISYALSPDFLLPRPLAAARKGWLGLAPFAADPATTSMRSGDTWMPLPYSGQEVRSIAALYQGESWLGDAARPGRFRAEAGAYRYLHLATHGRADERRGHEAYVVTARSGERLSARDLYRLKLAAELVVLSACESGGGSLLRGEGVIGLVRAFTYAGARSIVASLWVANDRNTADLMLGFYHSLRQKLPIDRALQQARLRQLDGAPDTAHPFFWAGFRVYGYGSDHNGGKHR